MSDDKAPDDESDGNRNDGYGDLEVVDDRPEFKAPPELVVDDGGVYGALYVTDDYRDLNVWWGREWICERCGSQNMTDRDPGPGVPEPPLECHGCERQGPFNPAVTTNDYTSPQSALELFTSKQVYTPPTTGFNFENDPTFASVYREIREYIEKYWAAGDGRDWLYSMLSCYVISTWFRERWYFVPHLLVVGRHETGKTRLLNTLSNVSYRCVHNASLTSAYLYRAINEHNCTMYISEYHRLGEEKQEDVDAVINAGQKRGETIGRCGESATGGVDPETFDPFSHIAISTQYEPNDDTISRCFQITTQPAQRSIPRRLIDRPDLRRKLLFLRLRYLHSGRIEAAEQAAEETMDDLGVYNRLSEKMWCILTIGELADTDLSNVINAVVDREEDRQRDTEESILTQALIDEAFEQLDEAENPGQKWEDVYLAISDVRDRFDRLSDREVSASYIGQLRNRVGLRKVRHSDGTKINDPGLKPKLRQLAEENNVEWGPSPGIVEDTHTIEISTKEQPKHSLEEENNKPTQEERRQTLHNICELLNDGDPLSKSNVVEMAAEQCEADESTLENELELLFSKDNRFDNTPEGEQFNYLG